MLARFRNRSVTMSALLVLVALAGGQAGGQVDQTYPRGWQDIDATRQRWQSQDLHLTAGTLLSYKVAPGQHLLLCQEGFTMAVAGRQYTARRALVWVAPREGQAAGGANKGYQVQVYLAGQVLSGKVHDGQDIELTETALERDKTMVVKTSISGQVFVTTEKSDAGNPRKWPLYQEAITAFDKVGWNLPPAPEPLVRPAAAKTAAPGEPNKPAVGYTIGYAPLTDVAPKVERTVLEGGGEIITLIGRMYFWWEQPAEKAGEPSQLLELEADSFVLWTGASDSKSKGTDWSALQMQGVSEIYVTGNIVFRQGQRTIYADDMYYDLRNKRGLGNNVVLKTFDPTRDVPIYIRAKQLRQLSQNEFEGQEVVLTTSEFSKPQVSLQAARIRVNDRTQEAGPDGVVSDSAFDVELKKVRFKYGDVTLLALPTIRANRERPDVPIRGVNVGYDNTFGASVETRWYLNRLLGLREPPGTDSTLSVDYYGKRGPGLGAEIDYEREDYFGSILGYGLNDHGEDRLSRTRKSIDVPEDWRGRFRLQHRQYLPYGWQLTAEASYLSDENFLEQFYRTEYNVGKEQETLLYLKRIQDNWGLAFLGKVRTNDFLDQVEELPSAEYHLTGQSLFDDRFTFFSDSQVSRYRYRFSPDNPVRQPDEWFWFTGTRNELDLPLTLGQVKVVPFVAGTFGYDDGAGFHTALDNEPAPPKDTIWIGEGGVRAATQPYWAVYPEVESRLWDLHQMRHVITPTVTATKFVASDMVADQRDVVDLQLAQRWQTKRGLIQNRRTVDWLELNSDLVWVGQSDPELDGPDRLPWSMPYIPMVDRSARTIPPIDRRSTSLFGPRQHYASSDGILRLTDSTAILGDGYLGMQTGTVEQTDIGFSRLVWPDLSYYVGTRYLRRFFFNGQERTSNAITFAVTYILDPRYTLVFSDQYDYGYGANITTDLTLIRKYHRMNLALSFSVDSSLDDKRVVLGAWPEGVPELALGLGRYMALGASDVYH
jgi:hypothetical protein